MNIAQFKRWLGIYGSGSGGPVSWGGISGKPGFAPVAFSGDYNDLTNRPPNSPGVGTTAWGDITDKPSFASVAFSGNYNDLTNRPVIPAGGVISRVSRKLTAVVNTKTVTVNAVGLGTQADLDAATLAASVDGTGSMVLTLSGLGSVKLSSLSVDVPAGANGGTGFTLVAPDPMGATTLADSSLASMAIYNDAGAVVASTLVTLAMSGSNLSVSKSGLTAGSAYRFKVIY